MIAINLTLTQAKKLQEVIEESNDLGSPDEMYPSDDLVQLRHIVRHAISVAIN